MSHRKLLYIEKILKKGNVDISVTFDWKEKTGLA
jgi:hypothetical protein